MTSNASDEKSGWRVRSEGMQAGRAGSTPTRHHRRCRNLFITPRHGENSYGRNERAIGIENIVRKISLSHPAVQLQLTHQGKSLRQYASAMSMAEREFRVRQALGAAFIEAAMYFEEQKEGMTLSGWVATPNYSRSQADQQYFFVNGRSIRDKVLSHAVRQGYHDVLHHGRQPAYVIFFELDPRLVDVNVHPTKHEVRFRESRGVHNFIFSTVHHVLSRSLAEGGAGTRSQEESTPGAQHDRGLRAPLRLVSPSARYSWRSVKVGLNHCSQRSIFWRW